MTRPLLGLLSTTVSGVMARLGDRGCEVQHVDTLAKTAEQIQTHEIPIWFEPKLKPALTIAERCPGCTVYTAAPDLKILVASAKP